MPPQAAGGGSKSRSTQTVIRGIFVVAAFAVVTLLAGHERMEVSNDRQSGKGHLHHGAVGGNGDALFRRDTYSSASEHRARPQPQRAHLLGQSGEVEEVGGAGGEELHNALSSLGDELDAAMAEHMAQQYQRQQQQQQQQQQGDMHQASRYELRDSSPRAQEGSIPSRLAMPRSQPLRGAIRSPPQPQRAQSSGMEEQQPPGRGDGGLLQKFENKIASMAGGWHVVPPPPSLPQAGAQAQPVQQQQQQSPRVRVDPPRSAVALPRSQRLSARSVRSPRVNPNSPRQLSEDEIVVKLRGKPYAGNFILNFEGRKPGDMLKQPKHLSEEGQRRRMERGKVAAASRTMKWEHIGILEKLWVEAGVVPASDEVRNRWLRDGPAQRSATCAVVGNGGGLLGMAAGNEIDKHDIVIRFNGGPVQGFQRFVGSKTTYRLTNYDHFAFSDVGDEIILQHMTNINGTKAVTRYSRSVLKKKSKGVFGMAAKDNVAFRVIDPEFHYMLMDLFKYGAPSNGFYGVTLAGEICASVTMYGFQKVWKGTKMPYHYYNDIEPNESQFGRDNNEAIFFQKWLEAVNMQAAVDTDWVQWKSATGWPFSQKFIFAEERHARTLPRLDINLDTVPWVKTGWNQETPNPEYIMSARGGSSPRDLRLSH